MNSWKFRTASEALPVLMKAVLEEGDEVGSRNGRTMELSPVHVELTEPWKREILVPGRKASLPAQIAESMWVLSGRDDIEWLMNYLPRANDFSDDGKVWRGAYGPRLRKWPGRNFSNTHDQLANVIELLQKDSLTRRAVISLWDPVMDHAPGKDIPCNNWLHFMNRLGKLDLHVTIRSNDLMWGWSGINAFEWSVLQEIVAKALGIQIGSLHFQISSLHLYEQHWSKAAKIAEAEPIHNAMPLPPFSPDAFTLEHWDDLSASWFAIEKVIREEGEYIDKAIDKFYEPMLKEWLYVLAYHWTGDDKYLNHCTPATRVAATWSANSPAPIEITREDLLSETGKAPSDFVRYVSELHAEKHKAYGDSWKRRGEMLGIMANIARKVDRLGVNGAGDTATDTAIDLLVYLVKYRWWLYEFNNAPSPTGARWDNPTDQAEPVARLLEKTHPQMSPNFRMEDLERELEMNFDSLEDAVNQKFPDRWTNVDIMIGLAYLLANRLWQKDKNTTQRFDGYAPE